MEKIKVWTSAVLIPVLTILQMGCATVMGGGSQEISLHSNPEGATVTSTRAGMEEKWTIPRRRQSPSNAKDEEGGVDEKYAGMDAGVGHLLGGWYYR